MAQVLAQSFLVIGANLAILFGVQAIRDVAVEGSESEVKELL